MQENNFKNVVIDFAKTVTPKHTERTQGVSDSNYVKWGDDNLYSNFLLELFHEVPLHNDIVKTKVNHIMGDGLVLKGDGKKADFNINDVDSFEEIVRKLVLDFLIFNFYVVEIQYNLFGKPISFNHIPAHHLRSNKAKTKFWVCDDWQLKRNVLSYERWVKGKNDDRKSKIFMYSGYLPSVNNVYPVASYTPAIDNMVTEMLIKQFNKNNLDSGFAPQHIISFYGNGKPTAEQAREIQRKFDGEYKGTNGAKFILNYPEIGTEKGVQVDTIAKTDYAAALTEVRNNNIESILTVHQATSRILFSIEQAGSLGDKSSIESSYQIFKELFVKDNRNIIESGLNKILVDAGFPEIEFKDRANLFTQELDPATREKVLTIDELRAIDNRPALPNGEGNRIIGSTPAPEYTSTATGSTNIFNDDRYKNGRILLDEDFELVKDLGYERAIYSVIASTEFHSHKTWDFKSIQLQFDDEKDVENYLLTNEINGKELSEIKADIKKVLGISITTDDLSDRIKSLTEAKLITSEVKDGKIKSSPVKKDDKRTIEIMYEYKVRAGYGAELIDTSRGFCVKLIKNDRLYTRSDIQQMSSIFGYNVFEHAGGWYFNPKTNLAENQCRHEWKMVRVVRKGDSK